MSTLTSTSTDPYDLAFLGACADAIIGAFESEASRAIMVRLIESGLLQRHVLAVSEHLGVTEELPVIVLADDHALDALHFPGAQALTLAFLGRDEEELSNAVKVLALSEKPVSLVCDWIAGENPAAQVQTRHQLTVLAQRAQRAPNTKEDRTLLRRSILVSLGAIRAARGLTDSEAAALLHQISWRSA
ncbi:MAG: hypothetical protein ACP5H2_09455 [Solirubrobacteraceae bacterium]